MAADHFTTFGAAPLCLFLFQELLDTMHSDKFKVLYHTHMVFCAIAFIEVFQPATGKILAFIAESYKAFSQQVAVPCHKGTVSAAWAAAGAVPPRKSLLIKLVFYCQVADAYPAIHPTRSNEFLIHIRLPFTTTSPYIRLADVLGADSLLKIMAP